MTHRVLTGITTTGTSHLGNYVGAIRPAVPSRRASSARGARLPRPGSPRGSTPPASFFYRQSDIGEIVELMCQIFIADLDDFATMNEVWEDWLAPGDAPPRATVQARLARPEWKVEMVVTAAV